MHIHTYMHIHADSTVFSATVVHLFVFLSWRAYLYRPTLFVATVLNCEYRIDKSSYLTLTVRLQSIVGSWSSSPTRGDNLTSESMLSHISYMVNRYHQTTLSRVSHRVLRAVILKRSTCHLANDEQHERSKLKVKLQKARLPCSHLC